MHLGKFLWSQVLTFDTHSVRLEALEAIQEAFNERIAIMMEQEDCASETAIKAALKSAKRLLKQNE